MSFWESIYNLRGSKFFAWFLGPILLALGPTIGVLIKADIFLKTCLKIFLYLCPTLLLYAWKLICFHVKPSLEADDLEVLLEAIDYPVSKKKDRFLHKLAKFEKERRKNHAKIFKEITRPDKQIEFLLLGLYSVFREYARKIKRDAEIKVVLFEFCGESLKYLSYYKDRPKSKEDELMEDCSCVKKAYKTNKTVIVDDINKELQKENTEKCFKKTSSNRDYGSIICFPFSDSRIKDAVLVLSVYCNQPGVFIEKKMNVYRTILKKFADRILIEYSLLNLKSGNCYERQKG